ncbi:MAG TPA: FAD-dependent oxidoreductase [Dongiaceae bacterium]|nr:FAD-dependent oxidoreductase [Dongiaceae bacterium]
MQVTVVGGGFGGVKTALELSNDKKVQVKLISDKPDFQYYPALYSTATGGSRRQSWVPLGEIFAGRDNVTVTIDAAVKLDKTAKTITTESGAVHTYQTLVLALGSVTTYFGIPGLNEYAYGIKSQDEIDRLKQHLMRGFLEPHGADSHYLIIGAGPTGVELASSLGSYLKHLKKLYKNPQPHMSISIIEAAPRVLPRMSEKASAKVAARLKKLGVHVETNKKVEAATADTLTVSGKPIKSHTVVWTSGVANNPFFKANESQFTLAPNGRVMVDSHLRVDPHIYVIGDNAITPFGGLAQTALHDGIYVAGQILGTSTKKYKAKQPPVVVPVGKDWAIFEYKKLRFGGRLGALVRDAADVIGYHDILPIGLALGVWRAQKVKEETPYIAELDVSTEQ